MGNGEYKISSSVMTMPDGRRMLDVYGGLPSNDINIHLWRKTQEDAQRFFIGRLSDGRYRISSKCSEFQRVIEVASSWEYSVRQWDWCNVNNQKWTFEPITPAAGTDYVHTGKGFRSKTMAIKNMGGIDGGILQAAINDWNYSFGSLSGANISITNTNVNAVNRIEMVDEIVEPYGDEETLGYYLPNSFNSAGYATNFEINICFNNIAATRFDFIKYNYNIIQILLTYRITIAHELGHALNLDDNPPNKYSIMSYGYPDEGTIAAPEYFDVYGVFKSNPIY